MRWGEKEENPHVRKWQAHSVMTKRTTDVPGKENKGCVGLRVGREPETAGRRQACHWELCTPAQRVWMLSWKLWGSTGGFQAEKWHDPLGVMLGELVIRHELAAGSSEELGNCVCKDLPNIVTCVGCRLMNDNLTEAEQIRGVSGNHSNSGADLGSEKERRVFPMGRQNVKIYIYEKQLLISSRSKWFEAHLTRNCY